MTTWAKVGAPQQLPKRFIRMVECKRCKGSKRVDRILFPGTRRCPACQGAGEVESRYTVNKRRKLQKSWDAKQRAANRREKQRLGK